jgi:hypothetical protein
MMQESSENMKEFPTRDVLSVVTGTLMGEIGGVYEVLNWMTGESLFTHQLPRVAGEAAPVILAAHPALTKAVAEVYQVTPDNVLEWAQTWTMRYGDTIAVPRLNADQHESIDVLSELAEKVHPDRIVVVGVGE